MMERSYSVDFKDMAKSKLFWVNKFNIISILDKLTVALASDSTSTYLKHNLKQYRNPNILISQIRNSRFKSHLTNQTKTLYPRTGCLNCTPSDLMITTLHWGSYSQHRSCIFSNPHSTWHICLLRLVLSFQDLSPTKRTYFHFVFSLLTF